MKKIFQISLIFTFVFLGFYVVSSAEEEPIAVIDFQNEETPTIVIPLADDSQGTTTIINSEVNGLSFQSLDNSTLNNSCVFSNENGMTYDCDIDGDGIENKDDLCITVYGISENFGCPAGDTNHDGNVDGDDLGTCTIAGKQSLAANDSNCTNTSSGGGSSAFTGTVKGACDINVDLSKIITDLESMTADEIQAVVNEITSGIECLGGSTAVTGSVTGYLSKCADLKYNDAHVCVLLLQQYLNANDALLVKPLASNSVAGITGSETAYFCNRTETALLKFQKENNITTSGVLDSVTKELIVKKGDFFKTNLVSTLFSAPIISADCPAGEYRVNG